MMMIGSVIQGTLFAIVIRFRSFKYAITADVAKMYRQIFVKQAEQDLQRILWRLNDNDIKEYKLTKVTYGTAARQFLAIRYLQEITNQNRQLQSIASHAICQNFYVDDFISRSNAKEEVVQLAQSVSSLLATRGFPFRKWASNDKNILQELANHNHTKSSDVFISDKLEHKTLGLI